MNKKKISDKKRLTALILCLFFGWMGLHRFYVNKAGTGFFMLFTFGGFGILYYVDFIMILGGVFTDNRKRLVANWI